MLCASPRHRADANSADVAPAFCDAEPALYAPTGMSATGGQDSNNNNRAASVAASNATVSGPTVTSDRKLSAPKQGGKSSESKVAAIRHNYDVSFTLSECAVMRSDALFCASSIVTSKPKPASTVLTTTSADTAAQICDLGPTKPISRPQRDTKSRYQIKDGNTSGGASSKRTDDPYVYSDFDEDSGTSSNSVKTSLTSRSHHSLRQQVTSATGIGGRPARHHVVDGDAVGSVSGKSGALANDVGSKDRSSMSDAAAANMIVPEKASSFKVHPDRCCLDSCKLCSTRFGSLDTPQHLPQIKGVRIGETAKTNVVIRFIQSLVSVEVDSCLCDRCFRFIDRSVKRHFRAKQNASGQQAGPGDSSATSAAGATQATIDGEDDSGGSGGTVGRLEDVGRDGDDSFKQGVNNDARRQGCVLRNCTRLAYHRISHKWLILLRDKLTDMHLSVDWSLVLGRPATTDLTAMDISAALIEKTDDCSGVVYRLCGKHSDVFANLTKCTLCHTSLLPGGVWTLGTPKSSMCSSSSVGCDASYAAADRVGTDRFGKQRRPKKKEKKKSTRSKLFTTMKNKQCSFATASVFASAIMSTDDVGELNLQLSEIGVRRALTISSYLCKPCKLFCVVHWQASKSAVDRQYMTNDTSHLNFYATYRKRILMLLGITRSAKGSGSSSRDNGDNSSSVGAVVSTEKKKVSPKITIRVNKASGSCSSVIAHDECGSPQQQHQQNTVSGVSQSAAHDYDDTADDLVGRMRKRRRQQRPFASPSSEEHIAVTLVEADDCDSDVAADGGALTTLEQKNQQQSLPVRPPLPCNVHLQFDGHTKRLWQEMQHPYTSGAAFLRHLLLLEKYWRSGDLTVSENASNKAAAYLRSMHNRNHAYTQLYRRSPEELSEATLPGASSSSSSNGHSNRAKNRDKQNNNISLAAEAAVPTDPLSSVGLQPQQQPAAVTEATTTKGGAKMGVKPASAASKAEAKAAKTEFKAAASAAASTLSASSVTKTTASTAVTQQAARAGADAADLPAVKVESDQRSHSKPHHHHKTTKSVQSARDSLEAAVKCAAAAAVQALRESAASASAPPVALPPAKKAAVVKSDTLSATPVAAIAPKPSRLCASVVSTHAVSQPAESVHLTFNNSISELLDTTSTSTGSASGHRQLTAHHRLSSSNNGVDVDGESSIVRSAPVLTPPPGKRPNLTVVRSLQQQQQQQSNGRSASPSHVLSRAQAQQQQQILQASATSRLSNLGRNISIIRQQRQRPKPAASNTPLVPVGAAIAYPQQQQQPQHMLVPQPPQQSVFNGGNFQIPQQQQHNHQMLPPPSPSVVSTVSNQFATTNLNDSAAVAAAAAAATQPAQIQLLANLLLMQQRQRLNGTAPTTAPQSLQPPSALPQQPTPAATVATVPWTVPQQHQRHSPQPAAAVKRETDSVAAASSSGRRQCLVLPNGLTVSANGPRNSAASGGGAEAPTQSRRS